MGRTDNIRCKVVRIEEIEMTLSKGHFKNNSGAVLINLF